MKTAILSKTASSSSMFLLSLLFAFLAVDRTYYVASGAHLFYSTILGCALAGFSFAVLLTDLTSRRNDKLVRSVTVILLASLWMAVGFNDVWNDVRGWVKDNSTSIPQSDALVSGYGSHSLLFLSLLLMLVLNKAKRSLTVLLLVCVTLLAFETLELYTKIQGTHVLFILLFLITAFKFITLANFKLGHSNFVVPLSKETKSIASPKKNQVGFDLLVLFSLNAVSYSIFVCHSVTLTDDTKHTLVWPLSAGFVLIVQGISLTRTINYIFQSNLIISGLFWSSLSANFLVADIYNGQTSLPVPVTAALCVTSVIAMVITMKMYPLVSVLFMIKFMLTIAISLEGSVGVAIGVIGWLGFLASVYGFVAYFSKYQSFAVRIPTFESIEKLSCCTSMNQSCCSKCIQIKRKEVKGHTDMLGYSKYVESEDIGFAASIIASLSSSWLETNSEWQIIPWSVMFGGVILFVVGYISFSRGKTFESCFFVICALFWSLWGSIRGLAVLTDSAALGTGCISFLVICILFVALSLTVNKIWVALTSLFSLIVLSFLLHALGVAETRIFELVVTIAFSSVCVYALLSKCLKISYGLECLPAGGPVIQISHLHADGSKAFWAESRRATGVKAIANLLREGKICGIPTDTVYVLVAACNKPEAVKRAYNTKKLAEDRPMSLWISDTKQIEEARDEFGDLLWDFVHEIWPSNISVVVKRGAWVDHLGLGDSAKFIGRPDSIAIRIPDNSITCHLISQTGPLAVTSANPTGEADTTHHLQVLAKLGLKNCDGILCDGPSPENAASTVVDCRNIDQGKIGFFRIGLTPKSKVEELFQKVLQRHNKSDSPSVSKSDSGISGIGELVVNSHPGQIATKVGARLQIGGQMSLGEKGVENPMYQDD